jgi:hypothetical protein
VAQSAGDRDVTRRERRVATLGAAALVLASVGLFLVSRGKWSDAIIDSGREWIVPDALARGELLYRDVVYWFGPFTPYFHAAFFRIFGSSFSTLVVAGVVGSVGVLTALYFALRRVTGKAEAALWTALGIPVLIFMPNAGGPILGMGYRIWHAAAFSLAAIAVAARPAPDRPAFNAAAAGALSALSGLCRTEWGLASLIAVATVYALHSRRPTPTRILIAGSSFLLTFGAVLGAFILAAGWKSVVVDGHVFLTGLPEETRTFLVTYSGVHDWKAGIAQLLYSSAMWLGAFFVVDLLVSIRDRDRLRRRLPWLALLFIVIGGSALAGGASGAIVFSAAPLVCLSAIIIGLSRRRRPRAAALTGFGLLGLLLSYRRPFHIGDGAYVGPPLLFAFVCSAGLLRLAVARARVSALRARLRTSLSLGMLALLVAAFTGRALGYTSDRRVPVAGTAGMISARPEVAREIGEVATMIRGRTSPSDALVVFPEGELLNYLSGRRNPLRNKLYIRGYLNEDNEDEILRELSKARPGAIVIGRRRTGEYGASRFGRDYAVRIGRWIASNSVPGSRPTRNQSTFELRVKRVAAR